MSIRTARPDLGRRGGDGASDGPPASRPTIDGGPLKASFLGRDPATGVVRESTVVVYRDGAAPELHGPGWQTVALGGGLNVACRSMCA